MPTITIVINAGRVETIYADTTDVKVLVMDKDIEGSDPQDRRIYADTACLYLEDVEPYRMMEADKVAVLQACSLEDAQGLLPSWMDEIQHCDALEVHPVFEGTDTATGNRYCEICEPDEAHFWSVYGHLKRGGIDCFEDFTTVEEAKAFAEKLARDYPHLDW